MATLNLCTASFYCSSFKKRDVRIERTLAAVESVTGRRLTHYVKGASAPRAIPGDRTAFVSRWLPGFHEELESQSLCSKSTDMPFLFVTLDNVVGLSELLGQRDPLNGAVHITFSESAAFKKHLVHRFAELIASTESFHAFLKLPPLERQDQFTRQRMSAELEEIATLQAISPVLAEGKRRPLMRLAHLYVHDLDEKPLTGVAGAGRTFALRLCWLNYWSDATAERMRFPDKTLDRPLEGLYERLPGGWLVKLTPESTDLDKPADRERLQWAYQRFASAAEQR
jgi:hypothetical protein